MRENLRRPHEAVQGLYRRLEQESDIELAHEPQTGILCLRLAPPGAPPEKLDALQQHLFKRFKQEAKRSISLTRLGDKTVLRFVAMSTAVTEQSMFETIESARSMAKEYLKGKF